MGRWIPSTGWVGVRIDRHPDWDEVAEVVRDAYRQVAPRRLAATLDATLDDEAPGGPSVD